MQAHSNVQDNVLPEAEIRAAALNGGNLVPRDGSEQDLSIASTKLQKLAADLLATINHANVSGGHKTAACNLLCTVISQCSQSKIDTFHSLIWNNQIWVYAFEIFLTQNHALSVKPLRQLLTSLTSALDKCRDTLVSKSVKESTLRRLAGVLCSTTEHVPIRPAMQASAHFLIKKLVSTRGVYEAICYIRGTRPVSDNPQVEHSILLETALKWAPYDDYSSSAGLLASSILESIKGQVTPAEKACNATFGSIREVPWIAPVLKALAEDPSCVENYRHYVLPELFKHDLQDFIIFLEHLNLHQILGSNVEHVVTESTKLPQPEVENLLFCALSVGNKMGLAQVTEADQKMASNKLFIARDALCIPDMLLGSLVLRSSSTVRIAGLSMLIASSSTTKPLSLGTIRALQTGLPFLHADADAGFRSEMFSLMRNLTDRLRGATSILAKLSTGHGTVRGKGTANSDLLFRPEEATALLKAHKSFLEWYISFLKMELRPSASYQRHISAVKCIALVYRSGVDSRIPLQLRAKTASPTASWPFQLDVIDDAMVSLLLDLLLDPFDDVREGAAEILSLAPVTEGNEDASKFINILHKAEDTMMLTGRADQADGVAHLYNTIFNRCSEIHTEDSHWWMSKHGVLEHLVQTLEGTLEIAARDMSKAVSKHPLHGIFISLRYIMETPGFYKSMTSSDSSGIMKAFHLRLYTCLHSVWACVKATLCNDAPEGFVPDEMDEEDDIGTKDILSYSWRALREASLLMRTIVKNCPLSDADNSSMTLDRLRDLGDLSFTQLAELRHRGAFSTVSQTFATCCIQCNSGSTATSGIIQDWYQKAMLCIQNQTTINTRRSAGLPSLMVGIVVADIKGDLYQRSMRDLTMEATKPMDDATQNADGLSQVHAMNCLKDMFKNSRLGEKSEAYIPEALGLAANCLSSDSWAIRNSGLMLFRALLDRLLGTNESYVNSDAAPQSRLSFAAVPNLMGVIFNLISPPLDTTQDLLTEGVFPALQLLQRTPPPADQLEAVRAAVLRLTASSQWHIRDKAAQTYAILTPRPERIAEARRLIESVWEQNNAAHGGLVSARSILQNSWARATPDDLRSVLSSLCKAGDSTYQSSTCPFTKAAFVNIYNDWCRTAYNMGYKTDMEFRTTPVSALAEMNKLFDLDRDSFAACSALRESLAHATLQEQAYLKSIGKVENDDDALSSLLNLANSDDADACVTMLTDAAKLCSQNDLFCNLCGELLTKLCTKLLFGDGSGAAAAATAAMVDIEVQTSAQDVLVALLDSQQAQIIKHALLAEVGSLYLPINAATPLFQDKRLVLQGALLELRFCGADAQGRSLPNDFEDWVNSVKSALHEDNPFDTRYAAAQATLRIQHGLRTASTLAEHTAGFLTYCLTVYDLTNDDDEEVRNVAAKAACNILQTTEAKDSHEDVAAAAAAARKVIDLIPLAAGVRLVEYISNHFITSCSKDLVETCISRLTSNAVATTTKSVQDILTLSNQLDTSLFIQEKQNLFVDEAREVQLWSRALVRILVRLSPAPRTPTPPASPDDDDLLLLFCNFAQWTTDGLETLLSTLAAQSDGPLGWKRRPQVFALGLRVISSAQVLSALLSSPSSSSISASSRNTQLRETVEKVTTASDIRASMARLAAQGKANDMQPLWLEQIEKGVEEVH